MDSKRVSKQSVLSARLDDDDDDEIIERCKYESKEESKALLIFVNNVTFMLLSFYPFQTEYIKKADMDFFFINHTIIN